MAKIIKHPHTEDEEGYVGPFHQRKHFEKWATDNGWKSAHHFETEHKVHFDTHLKGKQFQSLGKSVMVKEGTEQMTTLVDEGKSKDSDANKAKLGKFMSRSQARSDKNAAKTQDEEFIDEGKSRDSEEGKAKLAKFKERMEKRSQKQKASDGEANEEVVIEDSEVDAIFNYLSEVFDITEDEADDVRARIKSVRKRQGRGYKKFAEEDGNVHLTKDEMEEIVAELTEDEKPDFVHDMMIGAIDQHPTEFTDAFQEAIRDRIAGKVANRKAELSNSLFGVSDEEDEESSEIEEPTEDGVTRT